MLENKEIYEIVEKALAGEQLDAGEIARLYAIDPFSKESLCTVGRAQNEHGSI